MRPYGFNLGIKGWLFVVCFLLLLIMSVTAEIKETTKHEAVGKPIPQKFLDAYKYPTTQLVFSYPSILGADEKQVRYLMIGGTNEEGKFTGADYQTGIKLFDLDKEQMLFSRNLNYLPQRIFHDGNRSIVIIGKHLARCNVDLFQFIDDKTPPKKYVVPKYIGGCELGPGTIDFGKQTRVDGREIFLNVYWITTGAKKHEVIRIPYMEEKFPDGVLYTPGGGFLNREQVREKKGDLEDRCKNTLRALGSAQLAYQDQNLHNDYGTWLSLKNGYLNKGYTRSNMIEAYSISVFSVVKSGKLPNGRYDNRSSKFQIITVPNTMVYEDLGILGIGTDQTPYQFKFGNEKYWWWIENRYNKEQFTFTEEYWEPVR